MVAMNYQGHPWWSWLLQGIGVVLAYSGAELNSRLNVRGFSLWIAANVALFLVHVTSGLALLSILDVIYIRLNVRAIQRWKTTRTHTDGAQH
jgi:nicotinamide riboside transporter PnuC